MNESTSHLIRFLQQENKRLQEENKTLKEEIQATRRYMSALEELHWAARRIGSEQNLLNLLDEILYYAMRLVKADDGSVMLLDEDTDELVFAVVHGDIRGELRGYRIGADIGIAGWVAAEGEPVIANNPRQDWRFSPQVDEAFGFVTRSIICAPMNTNNKIIGVINLLNKYNGDEFMEADAALLSILGHIAATSLEALRLQFESREQEANTST
jgi:GAF domain-containing protein